ncbi:unnamed protein product [Symbiodinium natans]|uniref:Uncharacterized protein n=1 Tax=Symbiodinium natans TaxID=878477 RepID=A0A812H5H3_9DINO|nr:unnamed protein product [Symbiodinium natans]
MAKAQVGDKLSAEELRAFSTPWPSCGAMAPASPNPSAVSQIVKIEAMQTDFDEIAELAAEDTVKQALISWTNKVSLPLWKRAHLVPVLTHAVCSGDRVCTEALNSLMCMRRGNKSLIDRALAIGRGSISDATLRLSTLSFERGACQDSTFVCALARFHSVLPPKWYLRDTKIPSLVVFYSRKSVFQYLILRGEVRRDAAVLFPSGLSKRATCCVLSVSAGIRAAAKCPLIWNPIASPGVLRQLARVE